MAAILSVTYTPKYSGCHRIYFKTTQTDYCFYLDNSASEIDVPKTVIIDLTDYEECLVDYPVPIGCGDVNLIGYVQPCCTDANSLDNRVSFSTTYEQTPCTSYNIECEESGVGEFSIIEPGYGWPVGVTPTITVNDSSGYGSGFTGTVNMQCLPGENFCSIESITIDNPGEGYYFLNTLTVDITPPPSCESNELVIDGQFLNGLVDWNISPSIDSWLINLSNVPYYNIPTYGLTGGEIYQNILTPGRTYLIDFEKVVVQARSGTVRFIVTAGLFSITGTASNQYMIELNSGDPDYDGPLSIILTCFGSTVFSIYGDSTTTDVLNKVAVTEVSVIELCDAVLPEVEVSMVDDCGTFTVPNCDGTANPATYQLWGGSQYAINVCAGGSGPEAVKYTVTPGVVSCCNCVKYDVINTALTGDPIDFYYTNCQDQTITSAAIAPGDTITICAVPNSVWVADVANNQYFEYIISGTQDC
jgi:hypothetical protein